MVTTKPTHAESAQEVTERPDGAWSGTIACACGWKRVITDRPNEDAADLAIHAAWVVQTGRA